MIVPVREDFQKIDLSIWTSRCHLFPDLEPRSWSSAGKAQVDVDPGTQETGQGLNQMTSSPPI